MPPSAPDLLTLAEAIADGTEVDWDRAESSAVNEDEQRVVQQLRRLAGLGAAARTAVATWGPLEIRGEVGGGTFGTVYRAWDRRLRREVALKLLHPEHSSQSFASSVVKEGQLLAQIRHTNVVTVHGADVFDGRVGIWMEFVTGRTLKEILQAQGPFGAHEAALIGRDLCRALAAVHQRGFLHRDVKAQNVMREAGGRTVLMDFGAGDALAAVAASPLAGSPAYLAPEVLAGAVPSVQADLYSLGVLLFYLASGEFPVAGRSLDEFRELHASGRRRLLRDLRPDLPAAFVRAVDRATAPDLRDRPATAREMESWLESALDLSAAAAGGRGRHWGRAAIGGLALAATLAVALVWTRGASVPVVRHNSVAILPFKDLAAATPESDYFSDGITADLAGHLATIADLQVISGASVLRFKDRRESVADIGAQLGVATVLDGSIARSGDRLRISSQLFDVVTGASLWAQSFDRPVQDVVSLQSEISANIAVALRGELSRFEAERVAKVQARNFEAFDSYLRGRHQWSLRSEVSLQRSLQLFQRAIEVDSDYALAYSGMADAYTLLGVYGALPRSYAFTRAAEAASRAVALDGTLSEAHASLAYVRKNRMEWPAAEASFRKAIELKPSYGAAHHWYSMLLAQHARFTEAIAEIKTAIALDPLSASANGQLGAILVLARRYDDAVDQFHKTLRLQSDSVISYRGIAQAHAHQGRFADADQALDRAKSLLPVASESQELKADLGYLFAASGRRDQALGIVRELAERYRRTGEEVASGIAAIYAGLGRTNLALEWLLKAETTSEPELGYLKVEPRWDGLRDDRRFVELLSRLGL